jgi:hypothetical protein
MNRSLDDGKPPIELGRPLDILDPLLAILSSAFPYNVTRTVKPPARSLE